AAGRSGAAEPCRGGAAVAARLERVGDPGRGAGEGAALTLPSYEGGPCWPRERTLVAVKPDGVQRGLVGDVIRRFERRGFKLVGLKMLQAPERVLAEHYRDLRREPFYPALLRHMSSGPVVAMVWEGPNVVSTSRAMIGHTNAAEAAPGTIRGDLSAHVSRYPPTQARERTDSSPGLRGQCGGGGHHTHRPAQVSEPRRAGRLATRWAAISIRCVPFALPDTQSASGRRTELSPHPHRNVVHASDSVEGARREIQLWFQSSELLDWAGQHRAGHPA
ncbi:Nucleoside diphosphate kinase, mitochondrial, partial [Galemys pyrenaicus]